MQHATTVCTKYKERVRRLSGLGMQISPAVEDPDRPCRVACQDENVSHRFYLVNGEEGWFPFGTDCGKGTHDKRYCVSGKCLVITLNNKISTNGNNFTLQEFGADGTPLSESEFTLPLLSRSRRSMERNGTKVTATLEQHELDRIIAQLNLTYKDMVISDYPANKFDNYQIDLNNPIHIMEPMGEDLQQDHHYRDYYNEIYG